MAPNRDASNNIPVGYVEQGVQLVQEMHYDVWGLSFGTASETQIPSTKGLTDKYQYNSKEKLTDLAINWNDYGSRMYMAEIGRWSAVDPLT